MRNSNIEANFKKAMRRVDRQVRQAVGEWVAEINQKEVLPVTPKDTGELRDSLYTVSSVTYNGYTLEIGFDTPYAPWVHEWPSTVNWTTPGTGNKYLERPYFSNAHTLPSYIKARVRL